MFDVYSYRTCPCSFEQMSKQTNRPITHCICCSLRFNNTLFATCWSIFQCDDEDEESLRRPSGGQRKDGLVISKRHHARWVCLGGSAGNDHADGQTAGLPDVWEAIFHLDIEVSCENPPPKSRFKRLNSLVRCITREIESIRTGPDIKPSLKYTRTCTYIKDLRQLIPPSSSLKDPS